MLDASIDYDKLNLNFIPRKSCAIAWSEGTGVDPFVGLKVFLWGVEERAKYRKSRGIDPFKPFRLSGGCVSSYWNDLSSEGLVCECWSILLCAPNIPVKAALIEFGRISELGSIREMIFRLFTYKEFELYEDFLKHYYGCL